MVKAPFTWRMLARRGWLVVAACLVGIGAGGMVARVSASATSAFQVNVRGAHLTPYQTSRLALSYARLLPEDPGLLASVARATGRSPADVRHRLTMSAQPAAATVFARFSAPTADAALAGMQAVVRALGRVGDGAGSRLRATVVPLVDPTTTSGFSRTRALALGAAGGLLAGLALALVLERRRPRIDDLHDLAQLVPLPVSRVGERSLPAALARLSRQCAPGAVELVPVAERRRRGVLRRTLAAAAPGRADVAAATGPPHAADVAGLLRAADAATGPPRAAARALVVDRGASAASVEEAWHAAGAPPAAALLVDRAPVLRRLLGARDGARAA